MNYVLDPENRIPVSMISYLNDINFVVNLILLNIAFIVTLINKCDVLVCKYLVNTYKFISDVEYKL